MFLKPQISSLWQPAYVRSVEYYLQKCLHISITLPLSIKLVKELQGNFKIQCHSHSTAQLKQQHLSLSIHFACLPLFTIPYKCPCRALIYYCTHSTGPWRLSQYITTIYCTCTYSIWSSFSVRCIRTSLKNIFTDFLASKVYTEKSKQ